MNKNVVVAGLVATVVALGIVFMRQKEEIGRLKAAHALESSAMKEQAQVLAKAVRAEAKKAKALAEVRPVEAAAPRQAAGKPAPSEPAAPAAAQAAGPGTNFFGAIAGMMKNPQMKEMMRAQQKVMVDQMYGALPRYLNLSPETKERLNALLLERQLALAEAGVAMMSGTAEERKKAMEELQTVKAEYDQSIEELLGSQDYETFKQYEESVAEQTQVSMFKNALTGDDSLSEQQEYDLVSAMVQARKELPQDSLFNQQNQNADPSQLTEARVAEAIRQMEQLQRRYAESAATILNAAQLEQFKQWQQQMAAMQRAGLNMAAQMFGQGNSGAPAK